MRPLSAFALGLFGGLAAYGFSAVVFWYGMVIIPPYALFVITVVGVIGLIVAGISALALVLGLIIWVDAKMHGKTAH